MAEENDQEKTEEPTQQRREDFRKRGQVAQTKELASAMFLFTGVALLYFLSPFYLKTFTELFQMSFGEGLVAVARQESWVSLVQFAGLKLVMMLLPLMGVLVVISFASGALQVGFLYNEEALQFKPDRLNPIEGFKRVFSLRSVVEGIKAVIKVSCVALIVWVVLRDEVKTLPALQSYSVEQLMGYLGAITVKIVMSVAFFVLVIAGVDFLYQKFELEKKMMMSRQEVKEEMKSREGDPLIKSRIKRVQREMANKRMMQDVPKADVIVTNPTHISVALKYDETMVAPKIIAMGADHLAFKIREIAKEHKIPLVENKPLARAMYKTLKVGQQIPRELYTAVAEVLSYVYKLKRRMRRS